MRPEIWRLLRVPETLTLADLHRVIQVAMGWEDSHLYRFQIGGDAYGGGECLSGGDVGTRLSEIVLRPGGSFLYEYDFGDQWDHEVLIEAVLDPALNNARPACTGGQRTCPHEDCGGPWAYVERLRARKDRQRDDLGRGVDPARFQRAYDR